MKSLKGLFHDSPKESSKVNRPNDLRSSKSKPVSTTLQNTHSEYNRSFASSAPKSVPEVLIYLNRGTDPRILGMSIHAKREKTPTLSMMHLNARH